MVMLGILLSNLPYVGYLTLLGVNIFPFEIPFDLFKYLAMLGLAGFLLLVAGLFYCLKAPQDSESRNLMLFAGVALVLLRFLAAPTLVGLTWYRFLPPLHLAVELALLLALSRLAVYYRRRDLLVSYFTGAGLAALQALIVTLLTWDFFMAFSRPLFLLAIGCVGAYTLLVSLATGRLAVSAGEGPPKEDFFS